MPPDVLQRLDAYPWPGNVRELRNFVARRIALGDLAVEGPLPRPPPHPDSTERVLALDLPLIEARAMLVDDFERRYIERMLQKHNKDATAAAAAAGIARRYFQLLRARRTGSAGGTEED